MRASTTLGVLTGLLLATSTALCAQGNAGQRHAAPATGNVTLSAVRPVATADKTTMASGSQAAIGQTSIVYGPGAVASHHETSRAPANDNCQNAYYFALYAGSPVTFQDDNTGATEDCEALSGGTYGEAWYKFSTYETLNVVVKYCGTVPAFYNAYIVMDTTCSCSGDFVFASDWEQTSCGDGNWSLYWSALSAGTYYWPLLADSAGGYAEGPYTVTFDTGTPPPGIACPVGALFGQTPPDPNGNWDAVTSAITSSFAYKVYDNFYNVSDAIGGLHWWGFNLHDAGGGSPCDPTGMTFEVAFYADNAGYPGPAVSSCLVVPAVASTGLSYMGWPLYYFSVDELLPCAMLRTGWVSIQSQLNPADCAFLWMITQMGDTLGFLEDGGVLLPLGYSFAYCLAGGDCPPLYGACCNDYNADCTDYIEWGDCTPPLRFMPDTLCADLTPVCGIRGACCDAGLVCQFTGFEAECDAISGRFFPGENCDTWVCPADCEHRIDLKDCYGDGWNGNTLDVLVNSVTVLSQITLPSGTGPLSFYFMAATGDTIQTVYYPYGGWPYEPYYFIYDGLGFLLGSDGIVGSNCYVQPTGITVCGNCNPIETGACCYFTGGCDIVLPQDCIDGQFLGIGTLCSQCPCYVPCPPGASQEPEPCGDDTDGGCNFSPPMFAPIACGETVCGTTWANSSLRDTDWYQLVTTESKIFTWTAECEVPVLIFIMQGAGPSDCSSYTIIASATAGECQAASRTTDCRPAGAYWFWVGPSAWNNWPCEKDYTATLTCQQCEGPPSLGACCLSSGVCIPNVSEETCVDGCGGEWQGGGTDCDPNPCVPVPGCGPPAGGGCGEYIARVQLGAIDNSTGCTGYGDYTYLSADLPYAMATQMIVTNGNPIWTADVCTYWIDFNHDGVLSSSERGQLITGGGPYVFNITPPPNALPGPTCMRIRIDYANSNPQPCGDTTYGEVEDYTGNIVEVPGACCWPGGVCTVELPSECGGTFKGLDTTCDPTPCICPGDLNCDGIVDFGDINPFVLVLSNFQLWQQTYPGCPWRNGDIDGNGSVGFQDINPFVALIVQCPIVCQY